MMLYVMPRAPLLGGLSPQVTGGFNSLLIRHPEQYESHNEQHDQAAHAHIGAAGQLAAHTDDHGAQKGCALAADIEQAEVLARFFRRDDLGKMAPAQRLDAALEHVPAFYFYLPSLFFSFSLLYNKKEPFALFCI